MVAPSTVAKAAFDAGPRMAVLEGRLPRGVRPSGVHVARFLARPRIEEAALLVPLDDPLTARYAIEHWSVVDRRWKRLRKLVARELAAHGRLPHLRQTVLVASREAAPPFMISEAAARLGLPREVRAVLMLGQGDALSRNVFHLFPRGETSPAWVLKFSRVPGNPEPFEREERGLELARRADDVVGSRAPRLLGRFEHEGLPASVETAAVGHRLRELLLAPGSRAAKLRRIDAVAAWALQLALATASSPDRLERERDRLEHEVVLAWPPAAAGLVADLPRLPGVLQHNDLGSWNLAFEGDSFTVLDWESARDHGLPLWDLFYFLADALAVIDGASGAEERAGHTIRLFLGEAPSSPLLFEWTRRAVTALDIPEDAVGPIATLCWLHHSLSHVSRRSALDRLAGGASAPVHGFEAIAGLWLAEPRLREGWTGWRNT